MRKKLDYGIRTDGDIEAYYFIEYSAKVNEISTDEIMEIDFSTINKTEYPQQVKSFKGGLSLNKQIRWLQRCVKENKYYYMVILDGLLEQLNKDEILIKQLEDKK